MNNLAQQEFKFGQPVQGLGPLGNPGSNAPTLFNSFFSGIIAVMSAVAAIWFVFQLITGALAIISSEGDKAGLENARKKISTGFVGIIVIVAALFIVDVIGRILGIDLILDPGKFIETFTF